MEANFEILPVEEMIIRNRKLSSIYGKTDEIPIPNRNVPQLPAPRLWTEAKQSFSSFEVVLFVIQNQQLQDTTWLALSKY